MHEMYQQCIANIKDRAARGNAVQWRQSGFFVHYEMSQRLLTTPPPHPEIWLTSRVGYVSRIRSEPLDPDFKVKDLPARTHFLWQMMEEF